MQIREAEFRKGNERVLILNDTHEDYNQDELSYSLKKALRKEINKFIIIKIEGGQLEHLKKYQKKAKNCTQQKWVCYTIELYETLENCLKNKGKKLSEYFIKNAIKQMEQNPSPSEFILDTSKFSKYLEENPQKPIEIEDVDIEISESDSESESDRPYKWKEGMPRICGFGSVIAEMHREERATKRAFRRRTLEKRKIRKAEELERKKSEEEWRKRREAEDEARRIREADPNYVKVRAPTIWELWLEHEKKLKEEKKKEERKKLEERVRQRSRRYGNYYKDYELEEAIYKQDSPTFKKKLYAILKNAEDSEYGGGPSRYRQHYDMDYMENYSNRKNHNMHMELKKQKQMHIFEKKSKRLEVSQKSDLKGDDSSSSSS